MDNQGITPENIRDAKRELHKAVMAMYEAMGHVSNAQELLLFGRVLPVPPEQAEERPGGDGTEHEPPPPDHG